MPTLPTKPNLPPATPAPIPATPQPKETTKAVIIRTPCPTDPLPPHRLYATLPISPLETALHASDPPLPIPSLVSLPLFTRSHAWTGPHGDQRQPATAIALALPNALARPLFVNADPSSPDFGYAPPVRGDRLFGRMDGKDLSCRHLECLVSFCEAVVREVAGVAGAGRRAERWRRLVRREEFGGYWVRWCRRRYEASGVEEWLGVKGPYDV